MLIKRNSVFLSWLVSYVLILFVPIVFGIAVYVKAEKNVEYEITHSSRIMLEQIKQAMDGGLQNIGAFINQVQVNQRIIKLFNTVYGEQYGYYDDNVLQALKDIAYYRVVQSNNINDCFIYIRDIDKIMNGTVMTEQNLFYESKIKNGNVNGVISEEVWNKLINGDYSGQYIVMKGKDNSRQGIAYSINLPLNSGTNIKATLVVFLNYKSIQGTLQKIQTASNSMGIILNKDNELLFSTTNLDRLPPELKYENLNNESKAIDMTINGSRSVVSFINSNEGAWKYVSIIPYDIFWRRVEDIKLLTVTCTILCILLGISASYLLAKRNYIPVNTLVASLVNKSRIVPGKGLNEYKIIQDAVTKTINENQSMSELLRQQCKTLSSVFLTKLLKGKIEDISQINNSQLMYDMKFDSDDFAVVIFYIEDFKALFSSQHIDKQPEEKLALVRFIITNVFEELINRENYGCMTEVDDMLACLVNIADGENGRQKLMDTVHEAYGFINDRFGIEFTASVSNIHKTFMGIPEAYREALDTAEYQIAMGNDEIMCYSDIKGLNGKYNYSIEMENKLINCIKAGDYEKSISTLNEIYDMNFSGNHLSNSLLKCLMLGLANTMLKAMMEISYICGEELIEELRIEQRLLKCEKVQEMKTQMKSILESVCTYIRHNKKGRRDQLVDGIFLHIETNYSDPNLSVTSIAEKFDLASTYLTKLFKEQTAEGIYDCISRIRIEKAKMILKSQENFNIKEIAEKVGYLNSNIFIRAFKKQEGITPGAYKMS